MSARGECLRPLRWHDYFPIPTPRAWRGTPDARPEVDLARRWRAIHARARLLELRGRGRA